MKQHKLLLKLIYGYISISFAAVACETLGLLHPISGILAAIWLLIACFYICKYGNIK